MLFPFLLFTSAYLPAAYSLRPYTHALLLPELFQYSPLCQCSSLDFIWMVQTHPSYRLQDPWFSSSVHEEPFHEFALKVLLDILGERFSLFSAEYRLKDEGSHNQCHVESMYRCIRSLHQLWDEGVHTIATWNSKVHVLYPIFYSSTGNIIQLAFISLSNFLFSSVLWPRGPSLGLSTSDILLKIIWSLNSILCLQGKKYLSYSHTSVQKIVVLQYMWCMIAV